METPNSAGVTETIPPPVPAIKQTPKIPLWPVYTALTLIFGILLGAGGLFAYQEYITAPPVTTYDGCTKATGSLIQESYPATCVTRDGKRFTQPIQDDGINPIYHDPLSCSTDSDCTTGIQTGGCCSCPRTVHKSQIGVDNWESYTLGKDYSGKSTCKTFAACKPCATPSTPRCHNNQCVFESDISPTPPIAEYTCPTSEWIDCMPGPDRGLKLECATKFLTWAKANCPDFQGAAY